MNHPLRLSAILTVCGSILAACGERSGESAPQAEAAPIPTTEAAPAAPAAPAGPTAPTVAGPGGTATGPVGEPMPTTPPTDLLPDTMGPGPDSPAPKP